MHLTFSPKYVELIIIVVPILTKKEQIIAWFIHLTGENREFVRIAILNIHRITKP